MPCDSVITQKCDLVLADADLALSAITQVASHYEMDEGTVISLHGKRRVLKGDGVRLWVNGSLFLFKDGVLSSRYVGASEVSRVANLIKRSYAAEAVKAAAKRSGWQVKQQGQKLTLVRARV